MLEICFLDSKIVKFMSTKQIHRFILKSKTSFESYKG